MKPRIRPRAERLLLAAAACLTSGCLVQPTPPDEQIGFVLKSPRDVMRLRRVVFIELDAAGGCEADVACGLTRALSSAIQAKGLFHVDVVRRTDPMCRGLSLENMGALRLDEIAQLRDAVQCDAVLLGRVSHFQPFPRMQLGLVLKLMDLKDGELVWGVEQIWDTTSRGTERRIRRYFRSQVRSGYDPLGHELVLKSPRAFERFIAHEVADTLPRRGAPTASAGGTPGAAVAGEMVRLAEKIAGAGETP